MLRACFAIAVCTAWAGCSPVGFFSAGGDSPQVYVIFNEPGYEGGKKRIHNELIDLFARAEPDSHIYFSLFRFKNDELLDAILDAHERGVKIRAVLDGISGEHAEFKAYADALIDEIGKKKVVICRPHACMGNSSNANKYYLFDSIKEVGGDGVVEHVVVQTSANTQTSHYERFNDMLVVEQDKTLYDHFLAYFEDQALDVENMDYHNSANGRAVADPSTHIEVWHFPSAGPDPVLGLLEQASCEKGRGGVRLLHNWIGSATEKPKGDRTVAVIAELKKLHKKRGCEVQLILRSDSDHNRRKSELKASGLTLFSNNDIHNKIMLVDAYFDGVRRKIVVTGSHIMTETGLRGHDNTILKIESDDLYDAYKKHWTRVRDKSERQAPVTSVDALGSVS